jgi:hypothetical protein
VQRIMGAGCSLRVSEPPRAGLGGQPRILTLLNLVVICNGLSRIHEDFPENIGRNLRDAVVRLDTADKIWQQRIAFSGFGGSTRPVTVAPAKTRGSGRIKPGWYGSDGGYAGTNEALVLPHA